MLLVKSNLLAYLSLYNDVCLSVHLRNPCSTPNLYSNLFYQFSTGGELLRTIDSTTHDGLRQVFATNVFGHYLMVRWASSILGCKILCKIFI